MKIEGKNYRTIWFENNEVKIIDQTKLPHKFTVKNLKLFVGYNRRYDPIISNIKKRIEDNEIGFVNYALTISRDYPYPSESFLKISALL